MAAILGPHGQYVARDTSPVPDPSGDVRHIAKAVSETVYGLPLVSLPVDLELHCLAAARYALWMFEELEGTES